MGGPHFSADVSNALAITFIFDCDAFFFLFVTDQLLIHFISRARFVLPLSVYGQLYVQFNDPTVTVLFSFVRLVHC